MGASASTPTVQDMHELLTEVTHDVAQRAVNAWRPAFGSSPGKREASTTAVLYCSDGATQWGEAPIQLVWKAGELLYVSALEHARAAARLLVPPFRWWAPAAEVRSAVEAAAQAAWLFDPAVPDGRTRVGRYYSLRLHMARRLEYTYSKVSPSDPLSAYGTSAADVETQAALLDLKPILNKKTEVIGYEAQEMEQIDKLVPLIVGDNATYSVLSGSAHSELWSLLGGYQEQSMSPLGLTPEEHEAEPGDFRPLVRACAQSLFKPIDHACKMFDRGALAGDLDRIHSNAAAVMDA